MYVMVIVVVFEIKCTKLTLYVTHDIIIIKKTCKDLKSFFCILYSLYKTNLGIYGWCLLLCFKQGKIVNLWRFIIVMFGHTENRQCMAFYNKLYLPKI